MAQIHVAIVERDPPLAAYLSQCLGSIQDIRIVGHCTSLMDFAQAINQWVPDIALVNAAIIAQSMVPPTGVSLQSIKVLHQRIKFVAVVPHQGPYARAIDALLSGAHGYLPIIPACADLERYTRAIQLHQTYVDSAVLADISFEIQQRRIVLRAHEQTVLNLLLKYGSIEGALAHGASRSYLLGVLFAIITHLHP